jgi:hypothetical protein
MNRSIGLVVLLLVAGCATDPAAIRAPWYDATYDEVAASWGKPLASSKDPNGSEMHLWRSEAPSTSGSSVGMGFGMGSGGRGVGIGVGTGISVPVGPAPAPLVCERRMTFHDGRVAEQEWTGDPHYCETFKRPGPRS